MVSNNDIMERPTLEEVVENTTKEEFKVTFVKGKDFPLYATVNSEQIPVGYGKVLEIEAQDTKGNTVQINYEGNLDLLRGYRIKAVILNQHIQKYNKKNEPLYESIKISVLDETGQTLRSDSTRKYQTLRNSGLLE